MLMDRIFLTIAEASSEIIEADVDFGEVPSFDPSTFHMDFSSFARDWLLYNSVMARVHELFMLHFDLFGIPISFGGLFFFSFFGAVLAIVVRWAGRG